MELFTDAETLDRYLVEHSHEEDPVLKELARHTYLKEIHPRMLSGHILGSFLTMFSKILECHIEGASSMHRLKGVVEDVGEGNLEILRIDRKRELRHFRIPVEGDMLFAFVLLLAALFHKGNHICLQRFQQQRSGVGNHE